MERRWRTIGLGALATVTTLMGFFLTLSALYTFEINDLTGDINCIGTYESPCISEFTVRNPNPYVVDIYNKDQVKLEFSPDIYDYGLFVPDGRCGASGSCACVLKDNRKLGFEGWRCVDFTNNTKPRIDKEYNFRFQAYSLTTFRLAGIKNNPHDTVKWGMEIDNRSSLDPVWGPERDGGNMHTLDLTPDYKQIGIQSNDTGIYYSLDRESCSIIYAPTVLNREYKHNGRQGNDTLENYQELIKRTDRYSIFELEVRPVNSSGQNRNDRINKTNLYFDIKVSCNRPIIQNGNILTSGNLSLDFNDLNAEYSDPIYDNKGRFIEYRIRPHSWEISTLNRGENERYIHVLINETYNISLGDIVKLDPQVNITDISSTGTRTNVTAENNFTHLTVNEIDAPYTNLSLYMSFDTNISNITVYDYSSKQNDGALEQGTGVIPRHNLSGVYGGAYSFDATGSRIDVGTGIPFVVNSNFTAMAWINFNDTSSDRHILSDLTTGSDGWGLLYDADTNRLVFGIAETAALVTTCTFSNAGSVYSDGKWHFFVGKLNQTGTFCFADGTFANGGTTTRDFGNTVPLSIGSLNGNSNVNPWNGTIDEVMVFNRDLTNSEITSIYQNTSSRFYPSGDQTFMNINLSTDSTENRVNITISSLSNLSSYLQGQIGDANSSGYHYGEIFNFTNNVANNVLVDTPNNSSLKIIFRPSSSNFYTSTLQNNITLLSFQSNITCETLPETGRTYILGNNISANGNCFIVTGENITLYGNNYTVTGNGSGIAVVAYNINNFTLKNIFIRNFTDSIDITAVDVASMSKIQIYNSNLTSVIATGRSQPNIAGNGGIIYIENSNATTLNVTGGTAVTAIVGVNGGLGGNITSINTTAIRYLSKGGDGTTGVIGSSNGGNGGFINILGNVNITRSRILLAGGNNGTSSNPNGGFGQPGKLIINYTGYFQDIQADYSPNLTLILINGTVNGGEIRFWNYTEIGSLTNLSLQTRITDNLAEINTTYLTAFNKTANISLYGTPSSGITNPILGRNSLSCSSSICFNYTSLTDATVVFNVSYWTNYSLISSDTCTYSSGNWNVLCSDNCIITQDTDINGNNLTLTGSGIFTIRANIANVDFFVKTNACTVVKANGFEVT